MKILAFAGVWSEQSDHDFDRMVREGATAIHAVGTIQEMRALGKVPSGFYMERGSRSYRHVVVTREVTDMQPKPELYNVITTLYAADGTAARLLSRSKYTNSASFTVTLPWGTYKYFWRAGRLCPARVGGDGEYSNLRDIPADLKVRIKAWYSMPLEEDD